jgi:hypothetical protein
LSVLVTGTFSLGNTRDAGLIQELLDDLDIARIVANVVAESDRVLHARRRRSP